MKTIKIKADFSPAPGPRYKSEGKNSGESFREEVLLPMLQEAINAGETLTVDLDGAAGYATSFLEESFGGLIRENNYRLSQLAHVICIKSLDEPELAADINGYMKDADALANDAESSNAR